MATLTLLFAVAAAVQTPATTAGQPTPSYDNDLLLACSAPLGERPERPRLSISDEPQVEGDLKSLRVTVKATGAFMRVFYDPASERIARARAACLGEQIVAVATAVGDDRRNAEWHSAVFTQDRNYVPPRAPGSVARWSIAVAPDGTLTLPGHYTVVSVIPHEQVHAWQQRHGASPPRWVSEGHATWIQRRITPAFDPIVAAKVNRSSERKLTAIKEPLKLETWGSVRPKREATMRQVSPEDRARMQADPNFEPTGTFTYGPDDFESDPAVDAASYPAANAVFEKLAARHGETAVRNWVTSLTASRGEVTSQDVATSIMRRFGENVQSLLR